MEKLNQQEIQGKMKELSDAWILKGESIHKEFLFRDFIQAYSFMTSVAFVAEKSDHHPNWENVYNKVNIILNTHDVGGLTNKDFQLAKEIDQIIKSYDNIN
ncbi:MAG: 4a-hydroxytetrahydrobiopterin dehydratase [Cytophagales bacterium]|nr:4a-hydroxytetrahydrobiopterin dehydratase [Cytophagales bacterium]